MQNTELSDAKNNTANATLLQVFEHGPNSFLPISVFPVFQEFILFHCIFTDLKVSRIEARKLSDEE